MLTKLKYLLISYLIKLKTKYYEKVLVAVAEKKRLECLEFLNANKEKNLDLTLESHRNFSQLKEEWEILGKILWSSINKRIPKSANGTFCLREDDIIAERPLTAKEKLNKALGLTGFGVIVL